jgi:hypothetical protein
MLALCHSQGTEESYDLFPAESVFSMEMASNKLDTSANQEV